MEKAKEKEKYASLAYEVTKRKLPKLVEKLPPDEICDELLSAGVISIEECEESTIDSISPKKRTRQLILKLLKAVQLDYVYFDGFCTSLERSKNDTVRDCGKTLRADFEASLKETTKSQEEQNPTESEDAIDADLKELKRNMAVIRKGIFQSDENLDAKYEFAKEFISIYISRFKGSSEELKEQLRKLCFEEFLIPTKLHEWCFKEMDKAIAHIDDKEALESPSTPSDAVAPLFSKDNVYHCLLLSKIVSTCDVKTYQSFLLRERHGFEKLSLSLETKTNGVEKYAIARKGNVLYVAFLGEDYILEWQEKYKTFKEGILSQVDRVPMLFFVEKIREGYQVVFTGFSFGGLLAAAVNSTLWQQASLSVEELQQNVACIAFAAPLVNVDTINKALEEIPDIRSSTYLFYFKDDVIPCMHTNVEMTKVSELRGSAVLKHLAELQTNFIVHNKLLSHEEAEKHLFSLKSALKEGLPANAQQEHQRPYGKCHLIYSERGNMSCKELPEQTAADQITYLSAPVIDEIKGDFVKQHSITKYSDVVKQGYLCNKTFGLEKDKHDIPMIPEVIPSATDIFFSRLGDEIALVVEGENLWFCDKMNIRSRHKGREVSTHLSNASKRSVHFNYTPRDENDLLVESAATINVHLFSHFCSPMHQLVKVTKQDDYEISFRQRQLARSTPTEIIVLSFLSAMLERPSTKYQSTGRRSTRLKSICRFLEEVVRIVPVESICHAICSLDSPDAWKCAEALTSHSFQPHPSSLFIISLMDAYQRLHFELQPQDAILGSMTTNLSSIGVPASAMNRTDVAKPSTPRAFSDVVVNGPLRRGHASHSKPHSKKFSISQPHEKRTVFYRLEKMLNDMRTKYRNSLHSRTVFGHTINELYPAKADEANVTENVLKPPISVLRSAIQELRKLQLEAENDIRSYSGEEDSINEIKALHNDRMIETVDGIVQHELTICANLLGAFMQQQIRIPFIKSPQKTAHILETTKAPSAVGVWALFSIDMLDMQQMLSSKKGQTLFVEVENYLRGIMSKGDTPNEPFKRKEDRRYAGKMQFLMEGMMLSVSCNSSYISYSLERQLHNLCKRFNIKPDMSVEKLVSEWDKKFDKTVLLYVMEQYRPLLARWLIWSLNIHRLREGLASHTTVGVIGLSNSGKSSLVSSLFGRKVIVGSTTIQRTTIPFLYNLEGTVDGLDVIDFPGVDDNDSSVQKITWLLLRLAQIVVVVIDYRRYSTESAKTMISILDQRSVPLLLCLTHADKLYANECLREHGRDCPDDTARRIIGRELERTKKKIGVAPNRSVGYYSFCQDGDSILNSDEGRETLQRVGIKSPIEVGKWLVDQLRDYTNQEEIASKLSDFISNDKLASPSISEDEQIDESYPSSIPDHVRGVTFSAEVTFEFTGDSAQLLNWEGYGIRIEIPPGRIPNDETCRITVRAVIDGQFNFPKNSKVVSAVYWIHSSHQFSKPVDVIIEHCVILDSIDDCNDMKFIIARCNQETLPYNFSVRPGTFSPNNREGLMSLKSFSFLAVLWSWFSSSDKTEDHIEKPLCPRSLYTFVVFGHKKNPKIWLFDCIFMKDFAPFKKEMERKYQSWSEEIPQCTFEFEKESLTIQCPSHREFPGWRIVNKCPTEIKRDYLDDSNPKSLQTCRIAFRWTEDGDPPNIDYEVRLDGAKDCPRYVLQIPTEDIDNTVAQVQPQNGQASAPDRAAVVGQVSNYSPNVSNVTVNIQT